ncbi:hypothetical protein D9M72_302700 [compost metagenome]
MRGIDADLERLQPVALKQPLERERVLVRGNEAVEGRECRRLAFTDKGEQHAAALDDLVGVLADALAQLAASGFRWRFQARAVAIEQPAVERAAQAAVFQAPEAQVRAAVRAVAVEHAVLAVLVAKHDKVLAHQANRAHRALSLELIDQRHRLPVLPQQAATGGIRADARHKFVLFSGHHDGGVSC